MSRVSDVEFSLIFEKDSESTIKKKKKKKYPKYRTCLVSISVNENLGAWFEATFADDIQPAPRYRYFKWIIAHGEGNYFLEVEISTGDRTIVARHPVQEAVNGSASRNGRTSTGEEGWREVVLPKWGPFLASTPAIAYR